MGRASEKTVVRELMFDLSTEDYVAKAKLARASAALFAIALAGCGQFSREWARFAGFDKVCIDGVTYLQLPNGGSVQLDRAGKVVPCQ